MTNKVSSYLIRSVIMVNNPICCELLPISGGIQLSMEYPYFFWQRHSQVSIGYPYFSWQRHSQASMECPCFSWQRYSQVSMEYTCSSWQRHSQISMRCQWRNHYNIRVQTGCLIFKFFFLNSTLFPPYQVYGTKT